MVNALVLEGSPHSVMHGWRHFQIIIRHNGGVKVTSALGQAGSGEKFAHDLRGKLFAAGTWEIEGCWGSVTEIHKDGTRKIHFPPPRPEILDELFSSRGECSGASPEFTAEAIRRAEGGAS